MKLFVAILTLTLVFNLKVLGVEFPLVDGAPRSGEELAESSKTRVLWKDPVSGETIPAWREHRVWLTHVWEQSPLYPQTKTYTVRRRMEITFTDMKGNLLSEGGIAQPMGTTAPPPPEPPPVVVVSCDHSYAPTWWGGGGGMTQSGGMWNPSGGYAGGMYSSGGMSSGGSWTSGGMNSVGGSAYAGGQVTSGLARQAGYSGNVSTTVVGGGMSVGGGSANYSRNSAGASSWVGGASAGAMLTVGEPRREVHHISTTPGARREVWSNMPPPRRR